MKKAKLLIVFALVSILTLGGCAPSAEEDSALTPEAENTPDITPTVENTPYSIPTTFSFSIEDLKDSLDPEKVEEKAGQKIRASAEEAGAAQEYRVDYLAMFGTYSFKLQVYEDGTGKFSYIVKRDEMLEGKVTIFLNEARSINKNDTDKLLKAIADNDFWNILTVHPDEKMGFDGTTVCITGYSKGNTHHISMWEPGKEYGIYKIFKAFYEYGNTISKDPLDEIDIDVFGV